MVFQSYALYPHMDVSRNMGFSMEIQGKEASARTGKIQQAANVLGLDKLLERLPRALSGGQRQRVAMERAIVRDPSAFLFDEPLSNLDAALKVEMRQEIAKLHQRLGSDSFIYAQVPAAGRLLCRCTGNTPLGPEAPIGLQLDLAHMHLFNEAGLAMTHHAA